MSSSLSVHRCRFVDYTPAAITAIAFPPLPLPPVKGKGKSTRPSATDFGLLAVGRANGNVELHEWTGTHHQTQARQAWVLQRVLPGPVPSKVDSLVFTLRPSPPGDSSRAARPRDLRLFSIGGGSEILEWNLETGAILRSVSSQAGAVWSIAANPSSTLLALGCEDGSVRILSLADDGLVHHRRFDRVRSRLLSIAWGPPVPRHAAAARRPRGDESASEDDEAPQWADAWLVAGCSDSSLRKFDVASGRELDRMTTDKARGERTLVWAAGVLGDGTIVSGDSLGSVKFWDSNTCTQLQSFDAHGADVLCLTIGPDGRSVYTSGVDQKVCQFSHVQVSKATEAASPRSRWSHTCSRRVHSHDVRAIAVWPPHMPLPASHRPPTSSSGVAPVLVSGGLDMSLVICPCALASSSGMDLSIVNPLGSGSASTFEDAYYRRVPYSTSVSPAVQLAHEARLILSRRDTGLGLWKIKQSASPGELGLAALEGLEDKSDGWEMAVDMEMKVQTNLVASAISSDGRWVAASDLREIKLFRLVHGGTEIRPKRVKLSMEHAIASAGATSLLFTPDSSKLILGTSMSTACVVVVDLAGEDSSTPRVLRCFEHHRMQSVIVGENQWRLVKNLPTPDVDREMDVSGDNPHTMSGQSPTSHSTNGPTVATTITHMAASMDGQWLASADARHHIHVFNLDSVQHHCALPSFPNAIAALTFDPSRPSVLVIGLANNTFQVFDVEGRQFPEWSRALCQGLPSRCTHLHDPLLGICFDPDPELSDEEMDGGRRALVWGASWMCKLQLAAPAGFGGTSKKRRRESRRHSAAALVPGRGDDHNTQDPEEDPDFRIVTRYRPMLLVGFVGKGELVVVERPLVDVLSTLPPAYFRSTYGS